MKVNWKKTLLVVVDLILAVYLILAITAFNKPVANGQLCEGVVITIADDTSNGFLSPEEIQNLLIDNQLYPKNVPLVRVNPRKIEDLLHSAPFVSTAQCYKTTSGIVHIEVTQRTPLIRIKSQNGDDYYIDDHGGIMPNSKYTSDLIIATGNISKTFSRLYITPMASYIMSDDFWQNQIEQINVLNDLSIELVPRVGNHIVNIGRLPISNNATKRNEAIVSTLERKLTRLSKFYRFGLRQVGWTRYDYIDIEFDNQIICRRTESFQGDLVGPKSETIEEEPPTNVADSTTQSANQSNTTSSQSASQTANNQ